MATANSSVAERIIDQAAAEVQDKMRYFESRSNQLLGEMSNAMTTLSGVTIEPVGSAPELPRPENAQFITIDMPDTPELNVTVPTPHLLDLDIENPTALTPPVIPNLEINLPDAPVMQNDIEIPSELTNFSLPEIDTNIEIGTLPALSLSSLDIGRDNKAIDISELLGSLDMSDLQLPEAPENPILNFPTLPSLNTFDLPVRPDINLDDIEISFDEWPVQGLPSVILADKGELNGTKIEVFAEATGMRIENAPARRGDAKGIVERYFRTLQDGFKPYLPGIVEPHMSRKMGGHDYRQDATLTLSEFTKIIIAGVLWHNNFHTLSKYDRSELMPGDIPAVPLMLWNWGLANMTGKLRSISEDVARINLMPHDQATVSDLGICIFGCYYTCTEALKQGWFHRGDGKRPSTLQVAYDPRSADHIYVRPVNDLKTYWICDLADRSRRFRGMTFWDVWLLTKLERKSDANAAMNAIVAKGTLLQQINDIAANAQSLKPTNSGLVKKDLGLQIRSNKQAEKNIERQKTAFRPKEQLNDNPADVVHIHGNSEQDYSYPDMTDLLFGDEENE